MQVSGQELLPVSRQQAWDALNDVEMLKASIAGCESLTPVGENEFEAQLALNLGLLKARFKARLTLSELDPPLSYCLGFEAEGGGTSHGQGMARVWLELQSPEQTLLRYEVQASVGGKVAQLSPWLVEMGARKVAANFFKAFSARLSGAGGNEQG